MNNTQPFFIVSSGRSGTHALAKALSLYPEVECHHEYMVHDTQPLAFSYYMRLLGQEEVEESLCAIYTGAVTLSDKSLWGDSSNKASWLIRPLLRVFPNAKFVWLVRDGRKVVSSYYNKLRKENYDDARVKSMYLWLKEPDVFVQPPPEKKYWWPLPSWYYCGNSPNQFELVCWHWNTINLTIEEQLRWVPPEQRCFYRLEDLVTQKAELEKLLDFLGLPMRDDVWNMLRVPDNVSAPMDVLLTSPELSIFWKECNDMMAKLGYAGTEEYHVEYHPTGWNK